jgi:hypothetical protein
MDAYRQGLSTQLAHYVTKNYKGHRRLNDVLINASLEEKEMQDKMYRSKELNKYIISFFYTSRIAIVLEAVIKFKESRSIIEISKILKKLFLTQMTIYHGFLSIESFVYVPSMT